ncbi:ankyrin [Rhodotorula sp. JG-1b]|nr:ankyrin [Rhodotorula sp. JG-1b]
MSTGEQQEPQQQPQQLSEEAIEYARQFFDAARRGDVGFMEEPLKAGLPANLTNSSGDTLIMLAAYHGHPEAVSLLLKHGADPNRLNDRGQSPLSGAVYKNEEAVIEALLAGGADPFIGSPNAWVSAKMFGQKKWEERFEQTRKLDDDQQQTSMQSA